MDAGRGGVRFADADWRRRQAGFRLEEREGVIGAGVSYVEANRHYGGAGGVLLGDVSAAVETVLRDGGGGGVCGEFGGGEG